MSRWPADDHHVPKARGQVPWFILLDFLEVFGRVDGLVLSSPRHHTLLDFLLCQPELLHNALCLGLLLSSNVYMLQAPGLSLQTFS